MPRITVATASPEDLDAVMAIWAAADATRRRPAGPVRTARVREKVETGEVVLLAHYGERAAGMALAETFVDQGSPDPSTGHISMVFVDPAVWGSGIGTKLLRDLQTRWPRLSVWTRSDNRRARRLYLSAGFTDSGHRSTLQDGDEIMQLIWS
ncbi:GNAT family N-acetyltransferase [Nocardioides sp. CER19]|uniref:GNAT family N-acetyltransferase n=1 Tax=Nocardioides sp. CER19 TaxID=3038538 RepID=UPI00244A87A9|nr:GNAT family N-acetyltransferase [Nocardioides sp. CER19]MDH2416730.1 GNAT family N-acetyltransferase [Nocardioides sp. CER19]